jgi:ABC-type cobalamin/Fe3+-siderophores transport system ATPase subunit
MTKTSSNNSGTLAIEVSELRKSYGEVVAVRGVSFEVSAGEVFCLLGPNGAGKTTTVEMLEGYRARTAGDVRVLGMDPAGGRRELRERVGIVLQQTGVQGDLTVSELLEMYGRLPPRGARPGGPAMIRVLLAEDQAMVRGALASPARTRARHRGGGPGLAWRRGALRRARCGARHRAARHRDARRQRSRRGRRAAA